MRFRALALVAAVGLVATLGTACGDDDKKDAPVYTITAHENGDKFSFDVPDGIQGGVVTLQLVSPKSNKAPHDFQLAELPQGHNTDELAKLIADESSPTPTWIKHAGGVGTVTPGQTKEVTVDLQPNTRYGFFCTESDDEGHAHAQMGMLGSFTTGDDSGADMPDADATVTAKEYTFAFDGLKAGEQTVLFHNNGTQLHMFGAVPINKGHTFEEAKKAFMSQGPPPEGQESPIDFEKFQGAEVFGPGESGVFTMDLKPGSYITFCFIPDYGDTTPHFMKGMVKELKIS